MSPPKGPASSRVPSGDAAGPRNLLSAHRYPTWSRKRARDLARLGEGRVFKSIKSVTVGCTNTATVCSHSGRRSARNSPPNPLPPSPCALKMTTRVGVEGLKRHRVQRGGPEPGNAYREPAGFGLCSLPLRANTSRTLFSLLSPGWGDSQGPCPGGAERTTSVPRGALRLAGAEVRGEERRAQPLGGPRARHAQLPVKLTPLLPRGLAGRARRGLWGLESSPRGLRLAPASHARSPCTRPHTARGSPRGPGRPRTRRCLTLAPMAAPASRSHRWDVF